MTSPYQVIIAAKDEEGRDRVHTQVHEGSWPPPERMALFRGRELGITAILTQAQAELAKADYVEKYGTHDDIPFEEIYEIIPLRQVSVSKISDTDAVEMTYVARGALYVLEPAVVVQ